MQGEADRIKEKATDGVINKVVCLCIHGSCNEGQALCSKCDGAWTGRLCEVPQDTSNINNKKKLEIVQK